MVHQLITMAEGKDAHIAQGAVGALGYLKSQQALPVLVRLLTHEDRWLRYKAANSIKKIGGAPAQEVRDVLEAVAKTAEPLQPVAWADPVQFTHGQLAEALFSGSLKDTVKDCSPKLVYPAIRAVATNPDGMARMHLRGYFENNLTEKDVQALGPDIYAAVKTASPADTMFANEIRMGGMKALVKYQFKEGMEACVTLAKFQGGHGSETRTGEIMKDLISYGKAAKLMVPQLKELIAQFNNECKTGGFPEGCNIQRVTSVEQAIKAINAATTEPKMRTIAAVRP
jgi:hypothetical protein